MMNGSPKLMMETGHFNVEELGMKNMEKWLPEVIGNIDVKFIQSGDTFSYLINKNL